MKASALQEFLRSLGGSLSAVGVPPKSLDDLRAAANALEPFKDLDLGQLADFLKRAGEFRRTGEVPVVTVPGLDDATNSARKLSQTVQTEPTDNAATGGIGSFGRKQELKRHSPHSPDRLESLRSS